MKDVLNLKLEERCLINNNSCYLLMKRILDVSCSFLALVLLWPVLLFISIMIKIEDPKGPILFKQTRNGLNLNTFKIYKFRSMYIDAEERIEELMYLNEQSGPVFKIKDDPRITKVGKFIRKTSLDELPQLFNVLKGDMSLVGPRPPLPRETIQYTAYQKQRLLVKPGLTCIWQVSGRNNISFDKWVELDLEYIKKRNFWFDLKLILMTIPVLFGDKNAS